MTNTTHNQNATKIPAPFQVKALLLDEDRGERVAYAATAIEYDERSEEFTVEIELDGEIEIKILPENLIRA